MSLVMLCVLDTVYLDRPYVTLLGFFNLILFFEPYCCYQAKVSNKQNDSFHELCLCVRYSLSGWCIWSSGLLLYLFWVLWMEDCSLTPVFFLHSVVGLHSIVKRSLILCIMNSGLLVLLWFIWILIAGGLHFNPSDFPLIVCFIWLCCANTPH